MMRALLKKCISEARLLWLSCALALYLFCWLRVWIVGRFEMSRFQAVVEQFREYERFSPVPFEQLFTYAGRIAITYDEPVVILCMVVWAISRGSDAISGEVGRGSMEMLLAQPIGRLRVLLTQAGVTVVGAILLATVVWLGIWTGISTTQVQEEVPATWSLFGMQLPNPLAERDTVMVPLSEKADPQVFVPGAFNLFSLAFCLAGLSTLMSSWDRYRWRTIGIVIAIYVVQLVIKIVGISSDDFAWLLNLSFFTAYEPEAFVSVAVNSPQHAWSVWILDDQQQFRDLGPLGYSLILLALGAASYVGAGVIFCRRDLPAPL